MEPTGQQDDMSPGRICPECGAPVPGDAPKGFCPKCLVKLGAEFGQGLAAPQPAISDRPSAIPTVRYFGDYELLREIARGGMGIVYHARQVSLNRMVALK